MKAGLAETRRSNAATERGTDIAERALVLGRRAWLIPIVDDKSPERGESSWNIRILVSNTGGVPGIIIRAVVGVFAEPNLPKEKPPLPSPQAEFTKTFIVPGSINNYLVVPVPGPALGDNLFESTKEILVLCHIEYTDLFEKRWQTEVAWHRHADREWYVIPGWSSFA